MGVYGCEITLWVVQYPQFIAKDMTFMIANYHMHTFRCGHATGTEREYIERSIEGGLKIIGFSDHMPFRFPDGYESGYRVPTALAQDYIRTLSALREEYKDKIEIHIGFECEYYPLYFSDMLNYARELGAEYLILGQHFVGSEHPDGLYCGGKHITPDRLGEYVDCVIGAMESGVFSYVAHPDVFHFVNGCEADYEKEMRRLCRAAARMDYPLELNFLGIRGKRHYPDERFWRIAGEEGCTAVFGIDSHEAVNAWDPDSLAAAKEITARYGLKVVDTVNLRPIK